jgi:hypothetical protein
MGKELGVLFPKQSYPIKPNLYCKTALSGCQISIFHLGGYQKVGNSIEDPGVAMNVLISR